MFKEENQDTPPNDKHFGVGSVMHWPDASYVVVQCGEKTVQLLSSSTLKLVNPSIKVADINHFTESEARKLHQTINDQTTFSDYSFQSEKCSIDHNHRRRGHDL